MNAVSALYDSLDPLIASGWRLFPLLAFILILIAAMVRQKRWAVFAAHQKYMSRIIVFLPVLVLTILLPVVGGWSFKFVPLQIVFESPNLTATAIKLGLYGVNFDRELAKQLPADQGDVIDCIRALSTVEAQKYQKTCGDNRACFEHIPSLTRDDIIAKIKESQETYMSAASLACKKVDIAKLGTI